MNIEKQVSQFLNASSQRSLALKSRASQSTEKSFRKKREKIYGKHYLYYVL